MTDVYFISDLHIGAGSKTDEEIKLKSLFSFLDFINRPGNSLYIVGDLFDFWFEYKHVVPKGHYQVFYKFYQLIQNNVEVHFLPGNHDYWTLNFFKAQIGFIVHPEELGTQIENKKFFLFHGDGISSKDKGYQLLKKIFRNPVNIFFYRWLHPDLGIPLARLTSNTSRKHTANTILNDEDDYLKFAVDKFNSGYDVVVLGHSHTPWLKKIDDHYLINLGDWICNYSYGHFKNGKLTLNYWKA